MCVHAYDHPEKISLLRVRESLVVQKARLQEKYVSTDNNEPVWISLSLSSHRKARASGHLECITFPIRVFADTRALLFHSELISHGARFDSPYRRRVTTPDRFKRSIPREKVRAPVPPFFFSPPEPHEFRSRRVFFLSHADFFFFFSVRGRETLRKLSSRP